MIPESLYDAVGHLADRTVGLPDADLEQPFVWGAHAEEGVRFALLGSYHELRDLAVEVRAARLAAGRPLTRMQHALAQYHAAYRDLDAALLVAGEADWEAVPAVGEWPLRKVLAHIEGSQRMFHTVAQFGLARARAGLEPAELPEGEVDRVAGATEDFERLRKSGSLADMRAYRSARHRAALAAFAEVTDTEADTGTLWWEHTPLSLLYRLHRFDAHLRQHTVQVDKTLLRVGKAPTEVQRLLRLVYQALAEAEGFAIGAADLVGERFEAVAERIRRRAEEVAGAVDGARAVVAAVELGDADRLAVALAENPQRAGAVAATGLSALMTAMYRGRPDLAAQLADAGADVWVWEGAALGRLAVVEAAYADWPGWLDQPARDGYTPLQLACYFGQAEVAEWLMDHGAKVGAVSTNPSRLQAVHAAAARGDVALVRSLLARGADPNARQSGGFVPLHAAAQDGNVPLAELLLAQGADPALATDDGRTSADIAAQAGHAEVEALLRADRPRAG
jgi:hypothetical protein